MRSRLTACIAAVAYLMIFASAGARAAETTKPNWHFHFGTSAASNGAVAVHAETLFSAERGFGFEPGATPVDQADCCTSGKPFYFSAAVPEGNYRVTVTLGDSAAESDNTIRAEARRLMVMHAATKKGETVERTFAVNVRNAKIVGGANPAVKLRGSPGFEWDDKLTLEFNGDRPAVDAVVIEPAPDTTVIFIAGDSTVTDQPKEPYVGWGQFLPSMFDSTVSVANYAESGRALYSFRSENRLDKILRQATKRDYVLIQFGHNDQKDKRPGAGAFTTYKKDLEQYVEAIRGRGATPILVTPMYRRRFDGDGKLQESLGDYPAAVRQVAQEQKVVLIDLHDMSGRLFQAMGPEGTLKAFVHYPANSFPGQTKALADDTHFNSYGAYELARCVIEGIRTSDLSLRKLLVKDTVPFDPSKPDAFEDWSLRPSPLTPIERPAGS